MKVKKMKQLWIEQYIRLKNEIFSEEFDDSSRTQTQILESMRACLFLSIIYQEVMDEITSKKKAG